MTVISQKIQAYVEGQWATFFISLLLDQIWCIQFKDLVNFLQPSFGYQLQNFNILKIFPSEGILLSSRSSSEIESYYDLDQGSYATTQGSLTRYCAFLGKISYFVEKQKTTNYSSIQNIGHGLQLLVNQFGSNGF